MLCDTCIHNTEYDTCYNQNEIANFEDWINEFGCQEFDSKDNYQKVIHAKWEELINSIYLDPRMICSNCGNISTPLSSWIYCPYCGATMDKE
ncbi:MAG: hypothetical protein MJZ37_06375 [Bacilli bacterium]|nr:hypothetical protein [Bacilli bacterium]